MRNPITALFHRLVALRIEKLTAEYNAFHNSILRDPVRAKKNPQLSFMVVELCEMRVLFYFTAALSVAAVLLAAVSCLK